MLKTAVVLIVTVAIVCARPQVQRGAGQNEPPQPYNFQYKVENPPTNTIFGQNEDGDQQGRVAGSYYVLLADGRMMTVEYTVDGDAGFVPKISFQQGGAQRG